MSFFFLFFCSIVVTTHETYVDLRMKRHTSSYRARSTGLIRIRRTPPFSDDAFDLAHLNPDESSELIQLIRKYYVCVIFVSFLQPFIMIVDWSRAKFLVVLRGFQVVSPGVIHFSIVR